ncbi:MAG: DUF2225 domain-containing protein [Candidatus Lokiarchaeota archaeon]|nr:DUF2225 domain-containing protein [Candidatus Lokiarchaeota archaeon]
MTTLANRKVICGNCGTKTNVTVVASTNSMGSPDLDTRPPQMERSTMKYWVQRCPYCGYCGSDLSQTILIDIVMESTYQNQLNNTDFPRLGNSFICQSMILERLEKYNKAGWASLRAAWTCDDAKKIESAILARKRAINLFLKASKENQTPMKQKGGFELMLAELYRRTKQFDKGLKYLEDNLSNRKLRKFQKIIQKLIKAERELMKKKDDKCHQISEFM